MKLKNLILSSALIAVLIFSVALTSCSGSEEAGLTDNKEITMETIDQYVGEKARSVNLSNFSDMFSGGYIRSFEVVPFFEYLKGRLENTPGGLFLILLKIFLLLFICYN